MKLIHMEVLGCIKCPYLRETAGIIDPRFRLRCNHPRGPEFPGLGVLTREEIVELGDHPEKLLPEWCPLEDAK